MPTAFLHWTDPDGRTQLVGQLDELGAIGLQRFSYASDWLLGGFSLGEGLPLQPGAFLPPGGAAQFGLFLDAGPDAWGRRVISRKATRPTTPTGYLLAAADETRQGALRFSASTEGPFLADGGSEPLESVDELYEEVVRFQSDPDALGPTARLLRAGTSQGGFRPKAGVRDADGGLWIAKFPAETDTYDVETCEAAALEVARRAGIPVPRLRHLRVDPDRAILLVERFDRTAGGRLGYQSMRTAMRLGADESADYQTMAATAGLLAGTAGRRSVVAAATLNICVNNIDDHPRNFGFLQGAVGQWTPAPTFDVVPCPRAAVGTPLREGTASRSVAELRDLEWGLPRRDVDAIIADVAGAAAQLYPIAVSLFGLDPEAASVAEHVRALAAEGA